MSDNPLGKGCGEVIVKHKWSNLVVLALGKCGLVEEDIEEIVTHPWDKLESLWLSYNHFGVKGIKTLSSKDWPKL